jgi:peptidoglycan hydrolase CwlO-like protein
MRNNSEKPKILSDVLPKGKASVFKKITDPLGRGSVKLEKIPKNVLNGIVVFITIAIFATFSGVRFSILAPTALSQANEEEMRNLETELEKIESEIDDYQSSISTLQNQQKTLNQNIKLLDAEIKKMDLQIKATTIQLSKLDKEISSLQKNIVYTEGDIDKLKVLLAGSLRELYDDGQESILELVLRNEKLSDLFGNLNSLSVLQGEVRATLDKLVETKLGLVNQKDVLSSERSDVVNLKSIKENQKAQLNAKKAEKDALVKATKGQESKYQDLLKKSKQSAAQIRSKIFSLLGGGELTFGEAYEFAKFASEQTGVRAALILAVLDRESSFGKNVGKCNYKTAMNPTRDIPVFLEMMNELGINPDSVYVSCANSDGAYGGAMGPAQFIPSTWKLYKARIATITGDNPPSPWKSVNAFVATALYLKDVGADKQTYAAERKAAAMYYAGSRWSRYLYSYGQWVVERANELAEDIASLNS